MLEEMQTTLGGLDGRRVVDDIEKVRGRVYLS